jgi:CO/xanthine dehydrogenase Mo-binding subunit
VLAVITHLNTPALALGRPRRSVRSRCRHSKATPCCIWPARGDGRRRDEEQAKAAAALIESRMSVTRRFSPSTTASVSVFHPWTPDTIAGRRAGARGSRRAGRARPTPRGEHEQSDRPVCHGAVWDGDALTVHDTTQYPHAVRDSLAAAFGIDPAGVRVLVPFVGGAFGAGLRVWPHTTLAALAARITKRPVKLVLTRAQMFTSVGHRPNTVQQLALGASRDGQLTAVEHVSTSSIGMTDQLINLITHGTRAAYACPNVSTRADPDSAEHSDTGLDACTRRSGGLVRPGVGHRRALVRAGHRSDRVAG